MFAIIRTGGKQYRVTTEATLKVEKIEAEAAAPSHFLTFWRLVPMPE